MRIRFVVLALAALVAGCAQPGPGDGAGTPTQTPMPSATAMATFTPNPTAEPTERPIGTSDVVATTVTNLRVRKAPGTDSESLGLLDLGTVAFVIDAPVVEGVPWYPLSGLGLPPFSGCPTLPESAPVNACPAWRGWVAGTSAEGDAWLERAPPPEECPEPSLDAVMRIGFTYRLICFGDDEQAFTAYWPELPPDAGLGGACPDVDADIGWLVCQHINYKVVTDNTTDAFYGLRVSIDPSGDVVMPERGQWLRITGHFDDPAAQRCDEAAELDIDPIFAVFLCRLEFVATAITPTTAP